jgi:hypothetical protein
MRAASLLCCALASTNPAIMAMTTQPGANLDKRFIAVSLLQKCLQNLLSGEDRF